MRNYFWVFLEKLGFIFIKLLSLVILARELNPSDFGVYGLAAVVVSIGSVLIDSGMGGALIKKKSPSVDDYSTVFTFNLCLSFFIAIVVIISADSISSFYNLPELQEVLFATSGVIVLKAFSLIQVVKLTKSFNFKTQTYIYLICSFIAFLLAWWLASNNFGYWALVWQQVIESLLVSIALIISTCYIPKLRFSKASFVELFGFGGKLMLSSIVRTMYEGGVAILLGKYFSISIVGYFVQANKIIDLTIKTLTQIVDKVSFPILVGILFESKKLFLEEVRRLNTLICFIGFFVALLLFVNSNSIVNLVLGEKWNDSIWIIQLMSVAGIGVIIESFSRTILKAHGDANAILISELVKRLVSFTLLFLAIPFGFEFFVYLYVCITLLGACFNMIVLQKYLSYSFLQQIKDFFAPLFSYMSLIFIVLLIRDNVVSSSFLTLFVTTSLISTLYLLINYLINNQFTSDLIRFFLKRANG